VKTGGGPAAQHCQALALVGLHRYGEAAAELDTLARSGFAVNGSMRPALFDQAGNAWLLAARPDSAIASFTAALAIDPYDADLLADRARALAYKKDWAKADSDLTDYDRALQLQPRNPDALVERGTSKFEAGDVAGARADWQIVVTDYPNSDAAQTARQHLADTAPQ
jgi:tetratricopeptide (TPR) repeat protein